MSAALITEGSPTEIPFVLSLPLYEVYTTLQYLYMEAFYLACFVSLSNLACTRRVHVHTRGALVLVQNLVYSGPAQT